MLSYYLVTELCEGGDLMDYICARKYLSEVCTRKFIRQIISAVDYLHRIGILHRDLKIENLLLDKNLNIKLIGKLKKIFKVFKINILLKLVCFF